MIADEIRIRTGSYGIIGLACVAACVLVPITQYKALYGISVGYGLSVAAIGWALYAVFDVDLTTRAGWLVAAVCFYGMRLATYLLLRDMGAWKPSADYNQTSIQRLKRVALAIFLSFLYAIMTTPILYACRNPTTSSNMPIALAWLAAIMEAIADGHKHVIKKARVDAKNKNAFQGPSGGLYRLTRHPNYTSELLFWVSILVAGYPSLLLIPLLLSALGTTAITSIMIGSSRRLEKHHQEVYGQQQKYKEWRAKVPYPFIPFCKKLGSA